MQNIVFIKASDKLRLELYTLGLDFLSVKSNSQLFYMVITDNLKLMKKLAKKYEQCTIYISDSRRQTFRLDLIGNKYVPTKLGTLKRSMSSDLAGDSVPGNFCLIVTEYNKEYHYNCHE